MKILHLVNDDKFIHFISNAFNACENVDNTFYVTVQDATMPLKYIGDLPDMHIIDKYSCRSKSIKDDLGQFDAIVVHYLDFMKAKLLMMAPLHIPIVWSGWGGDYYGFIGNDENFFLGVESRYIHNRLNNKYKHSNFLMLIKGILKNILRLILKKIYRRTNFILRKAIQRTDYFSSPIPEDFGLLKCHLGSYFKAVYTQINYGSVEMTFSIGSEDITGDNILVGNSATLPNNHFEVLRILSNLNLEDRKIVVPLSYGHAPYREAVIEQCHKLFREKFYPILDFMPLDQYYSLIASCSVVVMGHRRQQALGNTATMLYKGAKVFLDETSTVYQFFKNRGAVVYSLIDLKEDNLSTLAPLTNEQKTKNREVLETFWAHNVVLKNTQHLVNILRSHKGCTDA
jgi:hypothetical protein